MKKNLYYELSDNADASGIIMDLSGIMEWIKADMEEVKESDDEREYTIVPIWLTDKQYKNLPESDI